MTLAVAGHEYIVHNISELLMRHCKEPCGEMSQKLELLQ